MLLCFGHLGSQYRLTTKDDMMKFDLFTITIFTGLTHMSRTTYTDKNTDKNIDNICIDNQAYTCTLELCKPDSCHTYLQAL